MVWYRTALELNDEALPPLLGMAEEAGIFTIHPFECAVADMGQNGRLRTDVQARFDAARSKHRALLADLRGSQLPELVNAGQLRPATHMVALLMRVSGSDIHRRQLYSALPNTLLLGHDQINQLYDILKSHTPRDRQLSSEQFNAARLIISPSSEIKLPQRSNPIVAGEFRADDDSSRARPLPLLVDVKQEQIITELPYLIDEFDWIRDMGIRDWDTYANVERRGRKQSYVEAQRARAWELLQAYRQEMRNKNVFDWSEIPLRVLEAMEAGRINAGQYHAVLIDEAQDFGAVWFTILQRVLRPSSNLMFIVADGAQKIYGRSFSWKSLGIDVTGNRSRVLNRSYRNTYEILRTAYEVVKGDPATIAELQSLGDILIQPDLDSHFMRHGPLPIIWSLTHAAEEATQIANEIKKLHDGGYAWEEFGVFGRDKSTVEILGRVLKEREIPVQVAAAGQNIRMAADEVKALTLHSSKGLEFSVVFIAGADKLQPRAGLSAEELAEATAAERRLLYVGMTRARDRLHLTHTGSLPIWATNALSMVERRG